MLILIVEDDEELAAYIRASLESAGHATVHAADGHDALTKAQRPDFDLLILDRMLPKLDGIGVVAALRRDGVDVPVLMLTARGSIEDRVTGLRSGADDYLTKPFAFAELLARVEALGRRPRSPDRASVAVTGTIRLDRLNRTVTRGGRDIPLHPREFQLLETLMRNAGCVVTRERIIEAVWGHEREVESNTLDVYVRALRSKVDPPGSAKCIRTVRGVGYVAREEEPS